MQTIITIYKNLFLEKSISETSFFHQNYFELQHSALGEQVNSYTALGLEARRVLQLEREEPGASSQRLPKGSVAEAGWMHPHSSCPVSQLNIRRSQTHTQPPFTFFLSITFIYCVWHMYVDERTIIN